MPNEEYQAPLRRDDEASASAARRALDGDRARAAAARCSTSHDDDGRRARPATSAATTSATLIDAFAPGRREATDRPTVDLRVHDQGLRPADRRATRCNHSALLAGDADRRAARDATGLTPETEWDALRARARRRGGSAAAARARGSTARQPAPRRRSTCRAALARAGDAARAPRRRRRSAGRCSPRRASPGSAERLVTVVAGRVGLDRTSAAGSTRSASAAARASRMYERRRTRRCDWRRRPARPAHRARHLRDEPRSCCSASSASPTSTSGQQLVPDRHASTTRSSAAVSTRCIYAVYTGSRFVVAGTPSGVTLSREGGAHQSTITPGDRHRAAGPRLRRAVLRAASSSGCCSTGFAGCRSRKARRSTCGSRPSRSTRRRSPALVERRGEERCAPTCSPAASGCASPAQSTTGRARQPAARSCPRHSHAAELLEDDGRASGAAVVVLSSPDRLYRDWREASARAAARRLERARTHPSRAARPRRRARPPGRHRDRRRHRTRSPSSAAASVSAPCRSGSTASARPARSPSVYEEYDISPTRSSPPRSSRSSPDGPARRSREHPRPGCRPSSVPSPHPPTGHVHGGACQGPAPVSFVTGT